MKSTRRNFIPSNERDMDGVCRFCGNDGSDTISCDHCIPDRKPILRGYLQQIGVVEI